ncbi:MAG: Gfo/Idh/MocA family oxidoreductase, partial [Pisciglobus halotolerans]|nr:Gfo/Idh/MocA family oxidoreductase [Pisciglobus halotolerans]
MQQEIGYAIIGTGYFGKRLAEIINNMQGARVKAIYDPDNYKEVTMELECDVEPSVDSLVKRGDVDAVVVSSPNYLHKSSVLKAAEQKKDIFCEKPIA